MERYGKIMIVTGLCIVFLGIVVWLLGDRLRILGRLPGDIRRERGHVKVYIPLTAMLLLSVLASILIWLYQKYFR